MDEFEYLTKKDLDAFEARLLKKIAEQIVQLSSKKYQWIKSSEVKRLLKCSASTLQNLRNSGQLPFSKYGGTLYYNYYDILKIIEENKVQITPFRRTSRKKCDLVDEWNTEI
jgi:hypothetical protein